MVNSKRFLMFFDVFGIKFLREIIKFHVASLAQTLLI